MVISKREILNAVSDSRDDLNDTIFLNKFKMGLINAIRIVGILYFSNEDIISPEINIRAGSAYYYYYKDKMLGSDGLTYHIYESRFGTKKQLLHIVTNGKRVFGRRRRKLIHEALDKGIINNNRKEGRNN